MVNFWSWLFCEILNLGAEMQFPKLADPVQAIGDHPQVFTMQSFSWKTE